MKYDYMTMIEGLGGTTKNLAAVSTVPAAPDTAVYPQ